MDKERKISLPFYKIVYSIFFVAILSVIRGVGSTYGIGIALEAPMALLAAVFCADTYVLEISSKRSEVERLYPMKNRMASMIKRMSIQEFYLLVLAVTGYGMFYIIQKPYSLYGAQLGTESELRLFLIYVIAIVVTLSFWGILSNTLSCLFRNMWMGIGCCLILWIVTDSTFGEQVLGKWNLFSYTFRNIKDSGDLSWIYGKMVCVLLSMIMVTLLPKIIKKRG
ncbi:MAG TPA: hypothetical protein VJY54_14320 [Lachnospiraceae bacterium]|nr:hypothetical protein [Lachnospiraceae bacterium]